MGHSMKRLSIVLAGVAAAALLSQPAAAAPVTFSQASATYTQNGYSPAALIDGNNATGWAIADANSGTHSQSALLVLASALSAGTYDFTFVANQFAQCCGTMGEFSFGYTTDAAPTLGSTQTLVTYTGGSSLTGATFTFDTGRILVSGGAFTDAYTINGTISSLAAITGIFLNVHESEAGYPTNGPGRAYDGNFVVSELTLDATRLADGPIAAGVPEPATWAMLILGFGAVGTAIRSRRRSPMGAVAG